MQAVVPCLHFVKDQGRLLLGEHILQKRLSWNEIAGLLESASVIRSLRMAVKDHVPKAWILLVGKRFRKWQEATLHFEIGQFLDIEFLAPAFRPGINGFGRSERIVNKRHDVRLTTSALSHHHNGFSG